MSTTSWVSISEAAEHFSLHPDTIRRMISRGEIEAKRLGPRLIRVSLASIERSGKPVDVQEYARRIADSAPPLSSEQRTQLGAVLRGGDA